MIYCPLDNVLFPYYPTNAYMTIVEARPSSLPTGVEAAPSRELHKPLIPLSIANLILRQYEGRVGCYIGERSEKLRETNIHLLDSIQNLAINPPYEDAPIAYRMSSFITQDMLAGALSARIIRGIANTPKEFPRPNPREYEEHVFGRWGSSYITRQERRVTITEEMEALVDQEPHLHGCIIRFADSNPDHFDIVYAGGLDMLSFFQSF